MTPQLYVKLSSQIARQAPELADYRSQIAAAQPAIDAAQAVLDAASGKATASQDALTALQAELAAMDAAVLAEQEITRLNPLIEAAQATANADAQDCVKARADLAMLTSPRDVLQAQADAIAAAMAQCQAAMDAGGLVMSEAEIAQYTAQKEADRIIASFTAALEAHYDATAQQRRYDSRYTCTLRAGYPGPFQAEGLAFATWMDACNAQAYSAMAAVQAGQRAMPAGPAALIAELPAMVWPGV